MAKKRIHELAKELSISSGDLIQKIVEWKLLPGEKLAKLVASSGLEDYITDDISQRMGASDGETATTPQVVRRRKKTLEQAEQLGPDTTAGSQPVIAASPEVLPEAKQPTGEVKTPTVNTVEVVRSSHLRRQFESATIIAPPVKYSPKKMSAPGQPVPDFKKLVPIEPTSQKVEPVKVITEPVPPEVSLPEVSSPVVSLPEVSQPAQMTAASEEVPAAVATPEDVAGGAVVPPVERSAPIRKVTRELSSPPAKIISAPKSSFDAAKVVGSKPNWKDSSGGPGRNTTGGAPPRRPDSREGGTTWAAPRRPEGAAPGGRPAAPGSRPAAPGGRTTYPGRPATPGGRPATPGGRPASPDFRRPESTVILPPAEGDSTRRRSKKKKGTTATGRSEGEGAAATDKNSRRRDLVVRTDLYSEGDWERVRRRSKGSKKQKLKTESSIPKAIKRRIKVDEAVTVSELAHRLSMKVGDIIKHLVSLGVMASINQSLDFDTATLVAAEFGYEVERSSFDEEHILQLGGTDTSATGVTRPPVVTIMGHVDHGKTSLLDYIRQTNIQSGEAGGITQHIGAYHVSAAGRHITFLDTPGHEAFTAMRSRGAQVTDIVILIVAADDGVMPQTKEAAAHAKAAGVPIVVAINKVDKPGADLERVRREVMEIGLVPEAWGGDTVFVEISAKTGQGIDELMDMILLEADILDLKARPEGAARGRIIEARMDKGRGPVATVLIQEGLLKQGDTYVCGVFHGRIKGILDDQGKRVSEAGPAIPVEVQGISGIPHAGDEFIVLEDDKQARQVSQHRLLKQRESELRTTSKLTMENLFSNFKAGAIKGLNLIIKTDVQGSLEAIADAVMKLSTSSMKINIIHHSTGSVSETDILLASASSALIVCFGVRPSSKVQELADIEHIEIRYYDIIYKLIDDIKESMAGLLDPVKSEKVLGRAEVRLTFAVTKVGTIAGSHVLDGKIIRGSRARLLRDGVVVHDGRISSVKRLKEDVKEVSSGYECGISLENFNDVKLGDHIEAYQVEETAATVHLIDEALAKDAKDKIAAAKAAIAQAAADELAAIAGDDES